MLFRKEVINSKKRRLTGTVVIDQSLSTYTIVLSSVLTLFFIIAFLSLAEVSRKETVQGYLIPDKGLVKVYSGRSGTLDELYIEEGDFIQKGTILAKIVNNEKLANGIEYSEALKEQLNQQINALQEELNISDVIFKQEMSSLERQKLQTDASIKSLKKVKSTTGKRLNINQSKLADHKVLLSKGFMSNADYTDFQEVYLELLASHEKIEQDISELLILRSQISSNIQLLPSNKRLRDVEKIREISILRSKLYEVSNQSVLLKSAPESGYVTTIQPSIGAQVNTQSPLLSIIPVGANLDIELFLPTRSAGFIKLGDKVKIRFEAFPYQKFGMLYGEIHSIDKSLILPEEKKTPVYITEPVYRVKAKLNNQSVEAFGQNFPLKVGMLAEADIILERRSILEWMLEPLLAMKGTLQ